MLENFETSRARQWERYIDTLRDRKNKDHRENNSSSYSIHTSSWEEDYLLCMKHVREGKERAILYRDGFILWRLTC